MMRTYTILLLPIQLFSDFTYAWVGQRPGAFLDKVASCLVDMKFYCTCVVSARCHQRSVKSSFSFFLTQDPIFLFVQPHSHSRILCCTRSATSLLSFMVVFYLNEFKRVYNLDCINFNLIDDIPIFFFK